MVFVAFVPLWLAVVWFRLARFGQMIIESGEADKSRQASALR